MKYIISILSAIGIVVIMVCCSLCGGSEVEYLRIHIRANSNLQIDQDVKYLVKDAVVEALIPLLSEVKSKEQAVKTMQENFDYIQAVADATLKAQGFDYISRAKIDNEYFPARTYSEGDVQLTLDEGYYDALILELGSGQGDNWWCVVYPAFCFTKTKKFDNFVYISKILEIIQSII